jgi:hypothetical protein
VEPRGETECGSEAECSCAENPDDPECAS